MDAITASFAQPCVHLGPETGDIVEEGGKKIALRRCDLYKFCKYAKRVCAGEAIDLKECTEYQHGTYNPTRHQVNWPPQSLVVNIGAGGLGDAMLGLGAVAGLRAQNPTAVIVYRVGIHTMPFVHLFDTCDIVGYHEFDNNGHAVIGGSDLQMNIGYIHDITGQDSTPRIMRYCKNIGVKMPMLPKLRDEEQLLSLGSMYKDIILLAPFSNWSDREYPLQAWMELRRELQRRGKRVVIIDADPSKCERFDGEKIVGQSAAIVVGAILNSACLVGNDSGLSHLTGILNKPGIALCGQTVGDRIFGWYPKMTTMTGNWGCVGCYWRNAWQKSSCTPRCPALASILPTQIADEIENMINRYR